MRKATEGCLVFDSAPLEEAMVLVGQPKLRLRVAATPAETFDVDETIWLRLQPAQMAVVR